MSRLIPSDAYSNGACRTCGAPLVDLMGDDVCLACDVEPVGEEGVLTWREGRVGYNNEDYAPIATGKAPSLVAQ
jgi:uncharacterized Zn finger protein (UPF0148 family)